MRIKFPFRKLKAVCNTTQVYDLKSNKSLDEMLENKGEPSTDSIKINGKDPIQCLDSALLEIVEQIYFAPSYSWLAVAEKLYNMKLFAIDFISESNAIGTFRVFTSLGGIEVDVAIEHDHETNGDRVVVGEAYYMNTQQPQQLILGNFLAPAIMGGLESIDIDSLRRALSEEQNKPTGSN